MHLVLVAQERITASYGPAAPAVFAALDAALAARAAAGFPTRSFDPMLGLPDLGIAAASLSPVALVAQLRAIAEALAERRAIIESLWIIGGPQIVPFGSTPNPMRDRDGPIRSDVLYALASTAEPLARWPVGRTPDSSPVRPGFLVAQLQQIASYHSARPRTIGTVAAITAARWEAVTTRVLAGLPAILAVAPPRADTALSVIAQTAELIYCNLHGVRGGDAWYGQAPDDTELVPSLRPDDLAGLRLDGAVVVSQACFGARLAPANAGPTMAIALLAAGARGLFAAHGLTYGAPDPPPGESDLLARALLVALATPAARLGTALVAAQAATLREILRDHGTLASDDVKTLLGFMLYGDPLAPA